MPTDSDSRHNHPTGSGFGSNRSRKIQIDHKDKDDRNDRAQKNSRGNDRSSNGSRDVRGELTPVDTKKPTQIQNQDVTNEPPGGGERAILKVCV